MAHWRPTRLEIAGKMAGGLSSLSLPLGADSL